MTTIIGVHPLAGRILVDIYDDGSKPFRTRDGRVIWTMSDTKFGLDDIRNTTVKDNKHPGIRPRWAIVVGTNEDAEESGIHVGDKVYLEFGKWTRGLIYDGKTREKVWSIAIEDVLGIDENGFDEDEKLMLKDKYPDHI